MCDAGDAHSDVDELSDSDQDSEPEDRPSRTPFDPELDHDDTADPSDLVLVPAPAARTSFSLRGGGSAFSNRTQGIFEQLDKAVQSKSGAPLDQERASSCAPPKKRGVPDYLVHPERWTRYSLEEVPEVSDGQNRRVAHEYLSGLQRGEGRERDGERESETGGDPQHRRIFFRPNPPLKVQDEDQHSATKAKKRGMHLSHLDEEEEEEEEEGAESHGPKKEKRGRGQKTRKTDIRREEEEEEEEEEEKRGGVSLSFSSNRKSKSKNYRKSSEQDLNV